MNRGERDTTMATGKLFHYVARAANGSVERGELEAADRHQALRRVRELGLTPLGVHELAQQPPAWGRLSSRVLRRAGLAAAVLILLLLAGIATWRMAWRPHAAPEPTPRPAVPAGRAGAPPAPAADPAAATPRGATNRTPRAARRPNAPASVMERVLPKAEQAAAARPPTPRRPRGVRIYVPPGGTNTQPLLFRTQTEQILSYYANAELGEAPAIGLPDAYTHEDIVEILEREITVNEADGDEVNTIKANVAHAKFLLRDFLAQGGDMKSFIDLCQEEMEAAYRERQAAQRQVAELIRAGDLDGARTLYDALTAELAEKGIKAPFRPRILDTQP